MAKKSKGKGKAPQGRARQKQKSSKNFSQSPAWQKQVMMDDDDDEDVDTFRSFKGFAGAQERTRENGPRVPSFKLRNQAIAFVSAGGNTPTVTPGEESDEVDEDDDQEEDNEVNVDDEETEAVDLQTNIVAEPEIRVSETAMANMNLDGAVDEQPRDVTPEAVAVQPGPPADEALFVVDTVGDPSLMEPTRAVSRQRPQRAPSPARSDSSEEVVVFHGRKKPTIVNDPIAPASRPVAPAAQPITSSSSTQPLPRSSSSQIDAADVITKSEAANASHQQPSQTSEVGKDATTTPASLKVAHATHKHPSDKASHQASGNPAFTASGWATKQPKRDQEVNPDATWAPAPAGSWWRQEQYQEQPEPAQSAEDTIAELQAQWKNVLRGKKQIKDTAVKETARSGEMQIDAPAPSSARNTRSTDFVSLGSHKSSRRGKRGRKKDNRLLRNPVGGTDEDYDDEGDLEDEAAYIDYMENLKRSLDEDENGEEMKHAFAATRSAHNSALAGPSMVIDGEAIPDDEVLDPDAHADVDGNEETDLTGEDAWVSADDDEDDDNVEDEDEDEDDLGSSDLEDELEYTEKQQWEDEEDLRRRRVEALSDEKIAQLFAKQHELGIDADEIVIEDGTYMSTDDNMEGIGDVSAALAGLAGFRSFASPRRGANAASKRRSNGPTFVDASALADTVEQYGESGFDIMDFDRPSLRPTKKGRKGRLPPELETLSDDELRENLAVAWTNDRSRKAAKKAERETLRHEGMLGVEFDADDVDGGSGKADLKAKYPYGMTMPQVYEEIRLFLDNDRIQTRPFPPMGKNDRKALHEIASQLNIKSKSIGSGKTRFPVLVKTKTTVHSTARLERAIQASERGWLGSSSSKKGRNGTAAGAAKKTGAGKGGGFSGAAVSLRNGEVVGAGAAEIGKENFGHRMMEKMGWSKGQALGKEGEGRLVPVEQVMRSGRAGLG